MRRKSRTCKPGSVDRIAPIWRSFLSRRGRPRPLAAYPQRLGRGGRLSLLIWPCSRWGLPCRVRCRPRGELLPHLFTLARSEDRRRCIFCGTVRRGSRSRHAQVLPGSAPDGARTFLDHRSRRTTIATTRLRLHRNLAPWPASRNAPATRAMGWFAPVRSRVTPP